MKRKKLLLSAFCICAVVSTAFITKPFGSGSIYCNSLCTVRVDYRFDPFGTVTDPCQNGTGGEYVLSADNSCVQTCSNAKYSSVCAGGCR